MKFAYGLIALLALGLSLPTLAADSKKLRILTFDGYVPKDVAEDFRKETGIDIEVTLSGNEDIIARLRTSGGAGFDLAQPSQDRITGAQTMYHIYRPIDLAKVNTAQFLPDMLDIVKKMTTMDGKLYGLPFLWGAEGMVVNTRLAKNAKDYTDVCSPELRGKTTLRFRRPVLIGFAFAMGQDPFALYSNPKAYAAMVDEVGRALLACKPNLRFAYDSADQVEAAMRSDDVVAALLWDAPGWELNRENPYVKFVNPKSGGLGWQMTFALPARGENESAAYAWINFSMRPENAARIAKAAGNFTAARGTLKYIDPKLKAQFYESFPEGISNLHWYPPVPAGLEDIEAVTLAKLRAR